jgi:hypothetical protein
MKNILIIIFCLTTFSAFAQMQIKIEDAGNHAGDSVKICNKIYGGKYLESAKNSPTFLNVGGNYPDALLTLVIWNDTRKLFKKPPEEYYKGAQVCITGRIQIVKGKPGIIVSSPNQIKEVIIDKVKDTEPE